MDWILNVLWYNRTFNDIYTIIFFWFPLFVNGIVYSLRVWKRVSGDISSTQTYLFEQENNENPRTYYGRSHLTYSEVVGYILATFLPIVNVLCFVFDVMGSVWGSVAKFLEKDIIASPKERG